MTPEQPAVVPYLRPHSFLVAAVLEQGSRARGEAGAGPSRAIYPHPGQAWHSRADVAPTPLWGLLLSGAVVQSMATVVSLCQRYMTFCKLLNLSTP